MARNPVEENPVTRFVLGFAVVVAMFVGGGTGGQLFSSLELPFAALIGTLLGAIVPFLAFSWWYVRYDAAAGGG